MRTVLGRRWLLVPALLLAAWGCGSDSADEVAAAGAQQESEASGPTGSEAAPLQEQQDPPRVEVDRAPDAPTPSVEARDPRPQDAPAEGPLWIRVDVSEQRLALLRGPAELRSWPVSTSAVGVGSQSGSNRTPLGLHRVASTFGTGAPLGTIFESRANTGRIARIHTDETDVAEDHVLTRILWLEGQEPGLNQGGQVDSYLRYIYIHGTNEEGLIGRPASHGCVRMRNADVIELYEQVGVGTEVRIVE